MDADENVEGQRFRSYEIKIYFDITARIRKFEDEWWVVHLNSMISRYSFDRAFLCDGIDSMLEFIRRLDKNKGKT